MTLHERIRTEIESRILSGVLKPGEKIPSEHELMQHYRCSRMTVNKAVSALSTAGLLHRRRRAGTVVASRPTESMVLDVPDLAQEIAGRGQVHAFQLIDRQLRAPRADHPAELALAGSGRLLRIEGLHSADGTPLAYEERIVSVAAVPEIEFADFTAAAPGSWLIGHIPWTEAENRITAVAADARCARALRVAPGAACLSVERRTWRGDEGVTQVRQQFAPGLYELVARFGAS